MATQVGYTNYQQICQSFKQTSNTVTNKDSLKTLFVETLTLPPHDHRDVVLQSIAMRALKLSDSNLAIEVSRTITNLFIRSQTINRIAFSLVNPNDDVNFNLIEEITDQEEKDACMANCATMYLGYKKYPIAAEIAQRMAPGTRKEMILTQLKSQQTRETKL